jgi:hypothetical protein
MSRLLVPFLLLLLAACATTAPFEAQVTRFHVAPPAAGQTVAVVPASAAEGESLQFRAQAEAVAAELNRIGFPPAAPETADMLAQLRVSSASRDGPARESPVRVGVGVGGSTGGRGSGVGVGVSTGFGVGGQRTQQVVDATMELQLRRRADGLVLWEGRAEAAAVPGATATGAVDLNRKLAEALLSDFPGPSGQTRRVRL